MVYGHNFMMPPLHLPYASPFRPFKGIPVLSSESYTKSHVDLVLKLNETDTKSKPAGTTSSFKEVLAAMASAKACWGR